MRKTRMWKQAKHIHEASSHPKQQTLMISHCQEVVFDNSQSSGSTFFTTKCFVWNLIPTNKVATVSWRTASPGARRLGGLSNCGVTPGGGAKAGKSRKASESKGGTFILSCEISMHRVCCSERQLQACAMQ
jgi:hypothetical protein